VRRRPSARDGHLFAAARGEAEGPGPQLLGLRRAAAEALLGIAPGLQPRRSLLEEERFQLSKFMGAYLALERDRIERLAPQ
jgi:hypothetical protein